MELTAQMANQLSAVHFGGNWTFSDLKTQLKEVTWQQATTQVYDFNTIATLVYHINYFVRAVLKVVQGGPLDAKDKYSFDHPPIQSQDDWEDFLNEVWTTTETLADCIKQLPEHKLWEDFSEKKYGTYYRNIHGIIEHCHYHLGQIVLIKKILLQSDKA